MKKITLESGDKELIDNHFELIKGDFTPENAQEILNHLILEKINFHERQSFSNQIRFGKVDQHSIDRVNQLKENKLRLNELIKKAKDQDKIIRIASNFNIEII